MATIFHIALASDWAAAQASGAYTTSTLGRSLADEGFIHASRGDQWTAVRDRFYAGVAEPLVLLHIDTDLLDVPVIEELADPATGETFPHIYGRLPTAAVVKAIPLSTTTPAPAPAATGPVAAPRPAPAPRSADTTAPPESFSRIFFREMFFNVTLLCVVIGVGLLGAAAGGAVSDEGGTGIGGLAGMVVGIAVSVLLFRRRHSTA